MSTTGKTVVSDFGLICDRRWVVSAAIATYTVGDFVGSLCLPPLMDYSGRKGIAKICMRASSYTQESITMH